MDYQMPIRWDDKSIIYYEHYFDFVDFFCSFDFNKKHPVRLYLTFDKKFIVIYLTNKNDILTHVSVAGHDGSLAKSHYQPSL